MSKQKTTMILNKTSVVYFDQLSSASSLESWLKIVGMASNPHQRGMVFTKIVITQNNSIVITTSTSPSPEAARKGTTNYYPHPGPAWKLPRYYFLPSPEELPTTTHILAQPRTI